MNILLVPVAPLSHTKSRLRDCFSKTQLKDLTIAMFRDLGKKLMEVNGVFDEKLVYCNNSEIIELAEDYGLIGIKEELTTPRKSFDQVITDLNTIAINKFDAHQTIFTFLDLILISTNNFYEVNSLLKKDSIVVCPAIHSAGISILGRNPPEIVSSSCFSDPHNSSLISLHKKTKKEGIETHIYDSFRAGFDVDIKQDLVLAYKYLKMFDLTHTETYLFLKENLNLTFQKNFVKNNRELRIVKKY